MTNRQITAYARYVQAKHDFEEASRNLFAMIEPICEVCTDLACGDVIKDVTIGSDRVAVKVEDWTNHTRTYFFPTKYLDMTLDEIRKEQKTGEKKE